MEKIEQLRQYIDEADRIVFFTGAGISTESGIPDFRSAQGIYTNNRRAEEMISHSFFLSNTEEFYDFYRKTIALIESGKDFDSIFCTSDGKALYVMRALHQCGYRIPEDVGVIGFDNIDVSALTQPPLTTVSQQPYEGGRVACKALIRQIEYKRKYGILPPAEFHEMEPQLIIRQSTK